jgi:dTDP-4-dehydrorhamnose reductase
LNLPGGIYNAGSENDLTTYAVAETVFKEMGIGHRITELLVKDSDIYKDNKRDLRINNLKLRNYGITFPDTEEAVVHCINDFSYKIV